MNEWSRVVVNDRSQHRRNRHEFLRVYEEAIAGAARAAPEAMSELPLIRVMRVESHSATLTIPGWSAKTAAMAHRICATIIDITSQEESTWHLPSHTLPKVERGRHATCTIVSAGVPGNESVGDPVLERRMAILLAAMMGAADREACLKVTSHRVGLATHRVQMEKP